MAAGEYRMEEVLHTICTCSAWLLHKRELRCFVTGLRSAGESVAWSGCGMPVRSFWRATRLSALTGGTLGGAMPADHAAVPKSLQDVMDFVGSIALSYEDYERGESRTNGVGWNESPAGSTAAGAESPSSSPVPEGPDRFSPVGYVTTVTARS